MLTAHCLYGFSKACCAIALLVVTAVFVEHVLLNANVHVSLCDVFSSCFAVGALAPAEPGQARTIYQAIVDQKWGTAKELLHIVRKGKLSGSVSSISSLGEEHNVVDSWSLSRFMYVWSFSCDDVGAGQPFS